MAEFLSQEWLDLQCELGRGAPVVPGVSARVQHVVGGGPDGEVRYVTVVEDGVLVAATLGTDADADVTLASTYDDAVQILHGDLDADAAFMQGRLKVTGSMAPLLPLMVLGRTPEQVDLRARLAERTEL